MNFHERFDIAVDLEEARRRFTNRAYNKLFYSFLGLRERRHAVAQAIATALGDKYDRIKPIERVLGGDFLRTLQAIEAMYACFAIDDYGSYVTYEKERVAINTAVEQLLATSEVDLSLVWKAGHFVRTGAPVLDDGLVTEPLKWLQGAGYESVFRPFEKGLRHLLEAHVKKERLSDVITDMYEALEALAKIVTVAPNKELSKNQEGFIAAVKVSDAYKPILKDYIDYANRFRHAATERKPRPELNEREVENFVYLTGTFIRLAMPE